MIIVSGTAGAKEVVAVTTVTNERMIQERKRWISG
jgi:hypothetical protein